MQPSVPAKCTTCHATLSNPLVCSTCQTLHTPATLNYFELFGLPLSYQIDNSKLMAAFRAGARQVHPDRFATAAEETRNLATTLAALVNDAYSILKDPVQRANYMLELAEGPSAIEVREVPGTLLMEVMELREQLEEARSAGDQSSLESMREQVLEQTQQTLHEITVRADALQSADENQKKEFRKLLNAMRYYENLLDELAIDPLAATGARAS